MELQVTQIPATLDRHTAGSAGVPRRRRAAAYARVSSDHEDQLSSYAAQVAHYTRYIKSRADLEFVRVYTDEGISGTSTAHREGFKRMISDALDGKIELIIAKSVSRFARNTVDSLSTIRKLKERGVECYFEKENISTFDGKGELLLTIMASVAQEESRSISENCVWGQRRRFADGKETVPFKRFLGYDRGENGELVINEKEAELVREIYRLFLDGISPYMIAKTLTGRKIPTPGGKEVWSKKTITSILSNEKYKGDALLQKGFTVDYLTKRKKLNAGELPQYYVKGCHEGIISEEMFEQAQDELQRRSRSAKPRDLTPSIFCGECGGLYGSKVYRSTNKYRRVIWECECGECSTAHLLEDEVKVVFIKAVNVLIGCGELNREPLTEFDREMWDIMIEHITVFDKSDIRVTFKDGKCVTVSMPSGMDYDSAEREPRFNRNFGGY